MRQLNSGTEAISQQPVATSIEILCHYEVWTYTYTCVYENNLKVVLKTVDIYSIYQFMLLHVRKQ